MIRPRLVCLLLAAPLVPGAACLVPAVEDAGVDAAAPDAGLADSASDGGGGADAAADASVDDASLGLDPVGSAATLEIATWNLRDFPLQGDATVEAVAAIVRDLDIDLFALQEISDMSDFQRVLTRLPDYGCTLSPDTYGNGTYQKTGFLYKNEVIAVSNPTELFDDDWYGFPRSPFQVDVTATDPSGGGSYQFTAVVVHLKAGTTDDDHDRRVSALQTLHQYLDEQRAANSGRDYLLLGDFNAQLLGSYSDVFDPFLDDAQNYRFLTMPLAEANQWSLPAYEILIDHMCIADQGGADLDGDDTVILHLDAQLSFYLTDVSDHRPVVTTVEPSAWR